jgi:hypothetical protein
MTHRFVDHVSRALAVLPRCELANSESIARLLRGAVAALNEVPTSVRCAEMFRHECREVLIAEIHSAIEADDNGKATHELLRVALVRSERAMGLLPSEDDPARDREHPSEEWDEHHVQIRRLGHEYEECG